MNYYNKNKNILYRYRLSRVGAGCCRAEGLHCVSVCTRWRADVLTGEYGIDRDKKKVSNCKIVLTYRADALGV